MTSTDTQATRDGRLHLLIDADDTLWENNIYFEQAIDEFIAFLNHSRFSRQEVRAVIDDLERVLGYGSANFTKSLVQTYHRLAEKEVADPDIQRVRQFGEGIRLQPLRFLEGVLETLQYLAARHDLKLLTKGDAEEQMHKVKRSGVEGLFNHVIVVPEKNAATYHRVVREYSLAPERTWMVGNSPRSDINPALSAGLKAVFIPHPCTWQLEHESVQPAPRDRLLTLATFAELRHHF
jgi:putative hydrolase of the HAD superfamily